MWYNHEHNDHEDHAKEQSSSMKRRRFLKQGGLAAGAATVFSFFGITPFSPAHAASTSGVTVTPLDAFQAKPYLQVVFSSSDYHRFQQVVQHDQAGIFTVQELQAEALQVTAQEGAFVVARIPVAGGAGYSYYAAVFKLHTVLILQTLGGLFKSAGVDNIDGYIERDGQVVLHKVLPLDGGLAKGSNSSVTPFSSADPIICMADCANIPFSIAYLIFIACATVCAISAGIGCIICMIGAVGFGGGVMAGCAHRCF
jgi:hypothetical protein